MVCSFFYFRNPKIVVTIYYSSSRSPKSNEGRSNFARNLVEEDKNLGNSLLCVAIVFDFHQPLVALGPEPNQYLL